MTQYSFVRLATLVAISTAILSSAVVAQETQVPRKQDRPALTQTSSVNPQAALTSLYASKLFLTNHSQGELCQIAAERATNKDVKKFAAELNQEHHQMLESLRKMVPADLASASTSRSTTSNDEADDSDAAEDVDDETATQDTDSERTVVGRANYDLTFDPVMQEIYRIEKLVARNRLASAKSSLNENEGREFDISFIGLQIATCSNLVSELAAIENVGTPEFQRVVAKAKKSTATHLEHAREIAEMLAFASDDEEREDDFGDDDDDDDDDDGLNSVR